METPIVQYEVVCFINKGCYSFGSFATMQQAEDRFDEVYPTPIKYLNDLYPTYFPSESEIIPDIIIIVRQQVAVEDK